MKKHMLILPVFLVAVVALILWAAAPDCLAKGLGNGPGEFDDAACFFEFNAKDGDTGIAAEVDGEAWKWVKIFLNHRLLFKADTKGNLAKEPAGGTEMNFESNEPEVGDVPFQDFLDLFLRDGEGECKFIGKLIEGGFLLSDDELTDDFLCVPSGFSLDDGDCVPADADLVISWVNPTQRLVPEDYENEDDNIVIVCEPDSLVIDSIQVVIETAEGVEPSQELTYDLPATTTRVTVPADFLSIDTEYKFEILVVEENGNRTIWEIEFETGNPTCIEE